MIVEHNGTINGDVIVPTTSDNSIILGLPLFYSWDLELDN